MNQTLKYAAARIISLLPVNALRVFGYKLLGYRLGAGVGIGLGTVLAADSVTLEDGVNIGRGNIFKNLKSIHISTQTRMHIRNRLEGPFDFKLGSNTEFGSDNQFYCGEWVLAPDQAAEGYNSRAFIGSNCLVTDYHFVDTCGGFEMGDESWIAGRASQIWTHGAGIKDRDVLVGTNCYLGSAFRMAPGSHISNNTILAMGSVVTKKFTEPNLMLAGVPAKIIRENYDWKNQRALDPA